MKRALCFLTGFWAVTAFAVPHSSTNDSVVVALAVPGVKRVVSTSYGYRLETDSGSRTVYRTATGYRVEGGKDIPALEVRETSTGLTVQDGAKRGEALSRRAKQP